MEKSNFSQLVMELELPPNNLKLKEKLKMFEMVMVSSGYWELRANKQ